MTDNQRGPQVWEEVSAERYDEMLGVLPPEIMTGLGFLVGEPSTHRRCTISGNVAPDFQAFARVAGRYYGARQCMTIAEFKRATPGRVVELEPTLEAVLTGLLNGSMSRVQGIEALKSAGYSNAEAADELAEFGQ